MALVEALLLSENPRTYLSDQRTRFSRVAAQLTKARMRKNSHPLLKGDSIGHADVFCFLQAPYLLNQPFHVLTGTLESSKVPHTAYFRYIWQHGPFRRWTALTDLLSSAAFSHATFMHFGFNMMALWTIGKDI